MKEPKDKKICSLVKKGFQEEHPEHFGTLVGKPKYFCRKCGRAAVKKKMVCKPVLIENSKKEKK